MPFSFFNGDTPIALCINDIKDSSLVHDTFALYKNTLS